MSKEDRQARFKRLAESRTNEVINKIRVLGNCSNKSSYNYSEEEVNKIFKSIDGAVKESKARFKTSKKKTFKL
jgi:hypothetical protein